MSESEPPRIRVTLPGGQDIPARLLRWRQDETGHWWAEVTAHLPAAAVQQVDGEDYAAVPREPAERRYVLAADTRLSPPTAELHREGCWQISERAAWRRITPIPTARMARDQLKFPDITACQICTPDP